MRARRTVRLAAIVVVLALGAAACGDDDDDGAVSLQATYSWQGDVDHLIDEDELTSAVEARLEGVGLTEVHAEIGSELRELLVTATGVDELTVEELFAAAERRGVLRFRPVLEVLPMASADVVVTAPADDLAASEVVLEELSDEGAAVATYRLGPADDAASGIESARAELDPSGHWSIPLVLTEDALVAFNAVALACNGRGATCPTGQLAIVVDGEVMAAPTISQPTYERDQIVISVDLTAFEARELASVLAHGRLPIPLTLESTGPAKH